MKHLTLWLITSLRYEVLCKKYSKFEPEINIDLPLQEPKKDYDEKIFLKGAEIAYESILTSFAKGEKAKLKKLLTKDIFTNFCWKPGNFLLCQSTWCAPCYSSSL